MFYFTRLTTLMLLGFNLTISDTNFFSYFICFVFDVYVTFRLSFE